MCPHYRSYGQVRGHFNENYWDSTYYWFESVEFHGKKSVSIWTYGLRAQLKAHKIDELKLNGAEVLDRAKGFGSQIAWQTNEISPA